MDELQTGLEIAGTGVAVVFAALVSLALVTTVLGRVLRRVDAEPASEPAVAASMPEGEAAVAPAVADGGVEPAMVAAMTAAVQFVRRGPRSATGSTERRQAAEAAGAWRAQGRQALMASQGSRVRPRNSRD